MNREAYRKITVTFEAEVSTRYLDMSPSLDAFTEKLERLMNQNGPKALWRPKILTCVVEPLSPENQQSSKGEEPP